MASNHKTEKKTEFQTGTHTTISPKRACQHTDNKLNESEESYDCRRSDGTSY